MGKRPRSITVISWIFVAAGIVGLTYHASEFKVERPSNPDFLWVCFVRLLAILFGGYMLRGNNWARWGLVLWLGYHVILSGLHRPFELIVHSLLFAVVFYFLFRPQASAYFRGARPMTSTQKNLLLVVGASAVVVPIVFLFYRWSARIDRTTEPEVICFDNLRQIDAGKQIWMIEQHKTTNDIPSWDDLRPYFRGAVPPKCPGAGTYTIGRVADMPTCSLAGHTAAYRAKRP